MILVFFSSFDWNPKIQPPLRVVIHAVSINSSFDFHEVIEKASMTKTELLICSSLGVNIKIVTSFESIIKAELSDILTNKTQLTICLAAMNKRTIIQTSQTSIAISISNSTLLDIISCYGQSTLT